MLKLLKGTRKLMEFLKTKLNDLIYIKPKVFEDDRGYFMETYHSEKFAEAGIKENFVQDNQSKSVKGTLRGLHYQLNPVSQGKLVRVTSGSVYDVAVDLRKSSSTYGQSFGMVLNEMNKEMLYIPAGFAHGFLVLSDTAEFSYKCTNLYSPQNERSIIWNDPELKIAWPEGEKILSEKDLNNPSFKVAEFNF